MNAVSAKVSPSRCLPSVNFNPAYTPLQLYIITCQYEHFWSHVHAFSCLTLIYFGCRCFYLYMYIVQWLLFEHKYFHLKQYIFTNGYSVRFLSGCTPIYTHVYTTRIYLIKLNVLTQTYIVSRFNI